MPSKPSSSDPLYRSVYSEWGSSETPEDKAETDLAPQQHKLLIRREAKGRGGKTVTVIAGFQLTEVTLNSLAKQLKNLCGSGGTVKENTIELQGDHRPKVMEALTKLGYPCKLAGG